MKWLTMFLIFLLTVLLFSFKDTKGDKEIDLSEFFNIKMGQY